MGWYNTKTTLLYTCSFYACSTCECCVISIGCSARLAMIGHEKYRKHYLRGETIVAFKWVISVLGLCISGILVTATALANTVTANQQIKKYIDHPQSRINNDKIRAKQKKEQEKKKFLCQREGGHYSKKSYKSHPLCLSIEPYSHKRAALSSSDLVINVPTLRQDARLLLLQQKLEKECHELGLALPEIPQLVFGGKLEGQTSYSSTNAGSRNPNINFSSADFNIYIQANPLISGYMTIDYDPDELRDGSRVFMNRAFIMIGDLNRSSFYVSIGQVYVPFGRYSSMMVTTPVTQSLGRTRARAVTMGYQQTGANSFHSEFYVYQGLTSNFSHGNHNSECGTDTGYEFINGDRKIGGEIGTSFISNLADSHGIQTTAFLDHETLRHRVPALGIYGSLTIKPVFFTMEYISAIKSFDINDVSFAERGAYLTAFHAEANCTFKTGFALSSLGIGYGHTRQALAIGLPQDRCSVFYNVSIWKDTNFAFEYRHDVNYTHNVIITSTTNPTLVKKLNDSNNVVTAQFDLYF